MNKGTVILRMGTGELDTGFSHIEMYTAYPHTDLSKVLTTFFGEGFVQTVKTEEQIILTNNHGILVELRLMEYGKRYDAH